MEIERERGERQYGRRERIWEERERWKVRGERVVEREREYERREGEREYGLERRQSANFHGRSIMPWR